MGVLMAVNAFAAALKKKAQVWKKAAKAEPRKGGGYAPPEIPDGRYEARVSAESGVTEKGAKPGTPWVRLTATISDGAHLGKEPSKYFFLDGRPLDPDPKKTTNEQNLAGDLKTLLPDVDVEQAIAADPGAIAQMLDEVNSRNPLCKIGIRNWETNQGKNKGKKQQDLYFNDLLEGGDSAGQEEESSEEESEEGEDEEVDTEEEGEEVEEEESSEEEEVEEEAEEEEAAAPTKGDPVMFKPKGATKATEYKVITVNMKAQTVTLSNGKKKYDKIPWSRLE